jgi:hypothetical protein
MAGRVVDMAKRRVEQNSLNPLSILHLSRLTTTGISITPAGVNITATGIHYITATHISLRLLPLPLDPAFSLFLNVLIFCHEYHLLLFR